MLWINPIELLHLENNDPEKIDEDAIAQALRRQQGEQEEKPIIYRRQRLAKEQALAAVRQLDDPARVRYYHRLCSYPEMNSFLAGDCFARIEEEAFRDELVAEPAARQLQAAYDEHLRQALEKGRASEFAAFTEQVEKGGEAFQDIVFQGKSKALLAERLAAIRQLAERLERGVEKEDTDSLGQLSFLRERVPVDALNALPSRFDSTRNAFAEALARIVEALRSQNPALALGVARHARRLRADKEAMERLNHDYRSLESNVESQAPGAAGQQTNKWMIWAWIGALLVVILLALLLFSQFYDTILDSISSLTRTEDTQLEEYPAASGHDEEMPEAALDAISERLAEEGSISREELERILRESGGGTRLAEPQALLQLPWRERGEAFPGELSGEVSLGEAPMLLCFPPGPPNPSPTPAFTVIGDPNYDAVVFFFNGRKYFQQAYIPAKGKFQVAQKLNPEEVVSTMIIFGQEWDAATKSPCGTPGYFTQNIFYGGFAAYATEPPYLNLHRDAFLQLAKRRLMPSRQLEEEAFFDLLEKYR